MTTIADVSEDWRHPTAHVWREVRRYECTCGKEFKTQVEVAEHFQMKQGDKP